ncbi:gamma-interferon-inducible lysosomal thiol reductase-like [Amphibalanus amphitrite]|uniref:gamma-interferon-inducible lysosomal thiol reductase-like n=1 Tax=Amphibalanus amphitrite TaxID=1232801 RepID=UPI001C91D74B|nr:gamma-interferon-inducible lysosomal thiol reductase-like [Amphibalanus amphitrite]
MAPLLLLLLALSSLTAALPAEPAPLVLGVYYEALCPDSRDFVVDQLNTTYSRVPEIITPILVPWGKASVDADGVISCQHGDEECWGNRLLACVADAVSAEAVRVGVISCLMDKQRSLHRDGPACVAAVGLDWEAQTGCAAGDQSYQQALQFGQQTDALQPALTFVPTITLDGSQGSADQQEALFTDLLNTVCAEWQSRYGQTPDGCL